MVLTGAYVPLPDSTWPPLLSLDDRIEIDPLPLLTSVPMLPLVVNMPSSVNPALMTPSTPTLAAGHLLDSAVWAVSVHGRPLGDIEWLEEHSVILALEILPAAPGSVIDPVLIEPSSTTLQLNSEMNGPEKPSLFIVAVMFPPGVGVIDTAPATGALTAIASAASSDARTSLRTSIPPRG